MSGTKAQPVSSTRSALRRAAASAPAAQAGTASGTARIQALLDNPVHGTVNLPSGTFTISQPLRLHQGERIIGHHTTLRVAAGLGDYAAMLAGASATTDLSGLAITGVTFDQSSAANPIRHPGRLLTGMPRFVLLVGAGNGISTVISNNTLAGRAAYHSAAIEVHGDGVTVTGNRIRGYYRGVNVVASNSVFRGNHVAGAASPVDLWSVAPTALHNVTITGNVLNRNLPYWRHVLARYGAHLPAAKYLRPVTRDETSTLPFRNIVIHGNHG